MKNAKKSYSPRILVFACNACKFTDADGEALNQQPLLANVRVLRTMCTGRVHPAYVMRAFDQGVDGVLITGCPPGKCDFITGNEQAEASFRIVRNLARVIGIDDARLEFEWTDGSDAKTFRDLIIAFAGQVAPLGSLPPLNTGELTPVAPANIGEIGGELNARLCYDCGKCTAVCPVTTVHEGFSPRRIVRNGEIHADSAWDLSNCISCSLCDYRCPQKVSISTKIAVLRSAQFSASEGVQRPHGAVFESLSNLMFREEMPISHASWIPKGAKISEQGDTLLYVGCAPYHDAFFPNLDVRNLDAVVSSLKILNHLGIAPMILKDERCCGHDYYWSGDIAKFRRLAEMNKARIEASGARRIVFTCPECRHAIQNLYSQVGLALKLEMKSISEIISENIQQLNLQPTNLKVTFQDPCRQARSLGDTKSPREVMRSLPGVEFREMAHSGAAATCCAGKWSHCDAGTKEIQSGRLNEAARTGADILVTACPKCEIHLKCAMKGESHDFEIRDLACVVAEALPDSASDSVKKTINKSIHKESTVGA